MTDRELLEAAAMAAGINYDPEASKPHPKSGAFFGLWLIFDREPSEYDRRRWNPLTDDGDALRLAVKLDMNVFQSARSAYALPSDDDGTYEEQVRYSDAGGDPYAATRRAIVRAAATMAQTKETP
jgi:hypothetical protein